MRNYLPAGSRLSLACSCKAMVVMSLSLIGVHHHYVVTIEKRGERCRQGEHKPGARRLVAQDRHSSRAIVRDLL